MIKSIIRFQYSLLQRSKLLGRNKFNYSDISLLQWRRRWRRRDGRFSKDVYSDVYLRRSLSFLQQLQRCLDVVAVPPQNDNYVAIESSHRSFLSVKRHNVPVVWTSFHSVFPAHSPSHKCVWQNTVFTIPEKKLLPYKLPVVHSNRIVQTSKSRHCVDVTSIDFLSSDFCVSDTNSPHLYI